MLKYIIYISIEGIPLITRFKTLATVYSSILFFSGIEGIPLTTRFKTLLLLC